MRRSRIVLRRSVVERCWVLRFRMRRRRWLV